jgi:hypothetical protein
MPNPKYDNDGLLDFIAHFIATDNNAAHFPRVKFIELFTYPCLIQKSIWSSRK